MDAHFGECDFDGVVNGGGDIFDGRQVAVFGGAEGDLLGGLISNGVAVLVFAACGDHDGRGIGGGFDGVAFFAEGLDADFQVGPKFLAVGGGQRHEIFGFVEQVVGEAEIHADERALGVFLE